VATRGAARVGEAPTKPAVALNIQFDSNSTKISPKYRDNLNELGKALSELSKPTVEIAGHTDSIGSEHANQILSERRAESVKQYLVQNFSIPQERLIAKGYGKSRPIASNDTPEDRSKNRRIEIVRTGQ
jgi:OmpA-OmpF porin, OOP family